MPLWFQILYLALLWVATTYYLFRSWKRGVVTVGVTISLARRGFNGDARRDSEPGLYWFGMFFVLLFDLVFLGFLLVRVHDLFIHTQR